MMDLFFRKKRNEEFLKMLEECEAAEAPVVHLEDPDRPKPEHALTSEEILSDFGDSVAQPADHGEALEQLRARMLRPVQQSDDGVTVVLPPQEPEVPPEAKTPPEPTEGPVLKVELPPEQPPVKAPVKVTNTPLSESLLRRCRAYIVDEDGRDTSIPTEPLYQLESVEEILFGKKEKPAQPEPAVTLPPQESVKEPDEPPREVLSDIDTPPVAEPTVTADTGTVRFTPVKDIFSHTEPVRVRETTGTISLTKELDALPASDPAKNDAPIRETEFESFVPKTEYETEKDAAKLIRRFAVLKRRAFLQGVASVLLLIASAVFLLPALADKTLQNPAGTMTVLLCLLGAAALINADLFLSLSTLFSDHAKVECGTAIGTVFCLLTGLLGVLGKTDVTAVPVLGCGMLALRAWAAFWSASARLYNLKKMSGTKQKNAVVLLEDPATTFAMAKDSLEGDVLIAVARPTEKADGFMKYTTFRPAFGGKLRAVFPVAAGCCLLLGFAVGIIWKNWVTAAFTVSSLYMMIAAPLAFLATDLPLYQAAKSLKRDGIGFAGAAALERLQQANAVTLTSADLFPNGTVTLHDFKVLANNSVDDTLLRAASLTAAMHSPLAPLFRQITDSNKTYVLPDSDTVKYEEYRGISGWVEDELLFIGNRTLMEVHEIEVPDVEKDYAILRKGYFPVYIATGGKVCAMLSVQYDVSTEVAKVLRRTAGLGLELLVDNCDQNLTAQMICDYIGLYPDSLRVMSGSGSHVHGSAVKPEPRCTTPATFHGGNLKLARLLCCANAWRKSERILSWMYVLSAVLGVFFFIYLAFAGSGLPDGKTVLLYETVLTALGFLTAAFTKNI